jgi:hypothetical protein
VSPTLKPWLKHTITNSGKKNYQHHLLKETDYGRDAAIASLKTKISLVQKDIRAQYSTMIGVDLDPLSQGQQTLVGKRLIKILDSFPRGLDLETQKGIIGEIFAGVALEELDIFGYKNWQVPAYFFPFHEAAFTKLERLIEEEVNKRPVGRTGFDCMAFRIDDGSGIISWIKCEAKCTAKHDIDAISQAHIQVSDNNTLPTIHLARLVSILKTRSDSKSQFWYHTLLPFVLGDLPTNFERRDGVSYLCGRHPKMKQTWIPIDNPLDKYTGKRWLVAIEGHINNVVEFVNTICDVP